MSDKQSPKALLFTAPGCPHCPGVKAALEKLQQEGVISSLEVVDSAKSPERAAELGVRSVPWLQLGDFILTGAQTPQQLRDWAERAATPAGMGSYLHHLLANGELAEAEALLARQPHYLADLLPLLEEEETPIQVRLGISAIFESLEGDEALHSQLPALIELSRHPQHRVRSDACHFLGLSHSPEAEEALRERLEDDNAEVREIAAEALELVTQT